MSSNGNPFDHDWGNAGSVQPDAVDTRLLQSAEPMPDPLPDVIIGPWLLYGWGEPMPSDDETPTP